ncbi:MAG: site-specific integrase [Bacteroidetes bacterium]|nr:site-specific integrase [Bacteroidota bacterium]
MASTHFYLKGAWNEKKVMEISRSNPALIEDYMKTKLQIICSVSTAGKRIKAYTTKRIEPVYWDFKKERANTKKYKKHSQTLNEFLGDLDIAVSKLAEQNENSGVVTSLEEVRTLILPHATRNKQFETKTSFTERFNSFLENHRTGKGFALRSNTKKKYYSMKTYLELFAKSKMISLATEKIDIEFLLSFQTFLNSKEKLTDSTKSKYIKALKTFIKYYQRKGVIKLYEMSEIKVNETAGEIYVLPLRRLIKLQNTEFSSDRLNKIRDQFCFMCWTGQRYGDYESLRRTHFYRDELGRLVWRLSAGKIVHGKLLMVPIIEYAQEILDKYDGDSLPILRISNQKFNEALKLMGEEAKLNYGVCKVRHYNGIAKIERIPFYKVLTAHVARKTYITNSLILGIPERVVKEVSGHKDEKSFRRYVNFADNYKIAISQLAYTKENVEKVLRLIGDEEHFEDAVAA